MTTCIGNSSRAASGRLCAWEIGRRFAWASKERRTFTDMGKHHKTVVEQARKRTAGEIMKIDLVTVQ